ncbi:hypothetical protein HG537_0H01740 [Torulaspora globosa]|uniref:F-box protein Hrt3/FBXO9 C-terminal domain-containing protein n=1 Tax=Torulaspora globosa TaxID=48254 RepID=A0A7H9I0V0_9SACH|nr:hypothetical protein HG537_0H01740 [Torulaspora sp. CBS 2947]
MSIVEDKRPTDQAEYQALSIWEKGVQKERDGSMTDAIKFYRQALRIDEKAEKIYRKKLREEWVIQQKLADLQLATPTQGTAESVNDNEDGNESDMEPCWIFEKLPNDLLLRVIRQVILLSGESWLNLSLSCTKFNELCFHDSTPFQVFASYIYRKQHYDETSLELNHIQDLRTLEHDLWHSDYDKMLKNRPYIKFEGLYISVVNYLRHGVNAEGSASLITPIQMITYYRYFRFYPDGRCLRLVTTDEPSQVVPHFSMDTLPHRSEICHWSLALDGHLIIRRSGDKYSFVEELQIKTHGRKRHNRLVWINSLVIDQESNVSECSLRNEKPFNFSRVRSFKPDD